MQSVLDQDPLAPRKKRRKYLVDKDFQSSYSFTWLLLSYCLALAVGFFSVTGTIIYYKYIQTEVYASNPNVQWAIIAFFMSGIVLIFWMVIVIVIVSVMHSHRVAGAVYRMRADIREVLHGDYNLKITLREKDYFKELSEYINEVIAKLKLTYKNKEIASDNALDLVHAIENDSQAPAALKQKASEVRARIQSITESGAEGESLESSVD